MSGQITMTPAPKRWFALIGIDFYMRGRSRCDDQGHPIIFPSLRGCVYDVKKVQDYIEAQFTANSQVMKLTSTQPENGACEPKENTNCWPTYANIVGLLERITREAHVGDLVHIHYSGHGARVKPPPGDNKEDLQKAIVPLDIACGGKYLFDFEITSLLDKMVKAGLAVTVVLDCCHSGDAGRNHCGGQSSFRGISQIDATENAQIDAIEDGVHRATVIQVPENLSAPAGSYEPNAERGKRVNSWNPQGYELLAACRVNERAYERRYENGQWHGVLTYNLLDSLKTGCANLTHGMLHRRLVAMVHGFSNDQTPFFKGDSQRYIFSRNRLDSQYPSITVKKLDGSYTILDAGSAQGIQVNNEYTIYPWDASDFSDSNRSSRVHVTEVYSLESKAVLMEQPAEDRLIEPGFQAIPYKTLVRELAVRFSKCLNSIEGDMFDQLKKAIDSGNIQDRSARLDPFVKVVSGPEESTAYHVGVDNSKYMLLNTSNKPINHFPSSANPKLFLRNIWHLAKFEFFRGLKNSDVPDYLKNFSFILEAHGTALTPSTNTRYLMKAGTPGVYLKFQNETTSPLNLTILNFEPSWGIEKVFPLEMDYYTVDPGSSVDQELELYLPDNWDPKSTDPVDCFKAFITAQATSFRSLVLPKLSVDGTATKGGSESTNSDLDMLLDELDVPDGPGRHVRLVRRLRGSWVTAEIEVCTIPAGSCTTHDENDSTDEFLDCVEHLPLSEGA